MKTHPSVGASALTIPTDSNLRMSSLEVAELMDKRHDHVMRDIKKLIEREAINAPNFGEVDYKDAKGEMRPMYLLDFQSTMVLITGYDAPRRAAVIDRWMKLERGEAQPSMGEPKVRVEGLKELQAMTKGLAETMKAAKTMGLNRKESLLLANELTRKKLGIGCLDYFGIDPASLPASGRPSPSSGSLQQAGPPDSPVVVFVRERCRLDTWSVTPTAELFKAFQDYCRESDVRPLAIALFCRDLYRYHPKLTRTRPSNPEGGRFQGVRGIGLVQEVRA